MAAARIVCSWHEMGSIRDASSRQIQRAGGETRLFFFFFFCLLSPFANFASRLSPPTILSTVRTVSVSCVGRLACFNHRPPRPLRSPLFFFSFFLSFSHFFTPPSPPSNVGLMEVISTFPVKLARIGFILTSRVIIVKRVREFAWKRFGRIWFNFYKTILKINHHQFSIFWSSRILEFLGKKGRISRTQIFFLFKFNKIGLFR